MIIIRGVGAKPHTTDALAKMITPNRKLFLRPYRSPKDPPKSNSEDNDKAYASTIHCSDAPDAWNADCKAGSATLMTVPSMNAMLEPKIAAVSTHAPSVDGTPSRPVLARGSGGSDGSLDGKWVSLYINVTSR
jgi:hypothetical protein